MEWRNWVESIEIQKTGVRPTNHFIITRADWMYNATLQIPNDAVRALRRALRKPQPIGNSYLVREGEDPIPVQFNERGQTEVIWIDAVGVGHPTQTIAPPPHYFGPRYQRTAATMWIEKRGDVELTPRWVGPTTSDFPLNQYWTVGSTTLSLPEWTIKELTRARAYHKAKAPTAQITWTARLGPIKWPLVWKIKSFFCSPRDELTWLKLQHRNLWVANRDPSISDPTCNARGCTDAESMMHLASCRFIQWDFWMPLLKIMETIGMRTRRNPNGSANLPFLILGQIEYTKHVDTEEAGILFLAWRCLYAEIIKARLENTHLHTRKAYARTLQLLISRLKANGTFWYKWYSRTKGTTHPKQFPKKYQNRKLLKTNNTAQFRINPIILKELHKVRTNL